MSTLSITIDCPSCAATMLRPGDASTSPAVVLTYSGGSDMAKRIATAERFWSKVNKEPGDGCWLWTGSLGDKGYGQFVIYVDARRRFFKAHRFAYELLVGPIPSGLQIDHTCHNADASCVGGKTCRHRACVNPAHLRPATNQQNTLAGNTLTARYAARTQCNFGHPFSPENTRHLGRGQRQCRACIVVRTWRRRGFDEAEVARRLADWAAARGIVL